MSERLARSAGLIGIATLASRVLGLVRDMVQAALFGTSDANDAFVLATRIPTLLRDLFAEGAMSAAFVPTFTRYLTKDGKAAAWRLGSQVINALLVVTGLLVVAGIIFVKPLTTLFGGHYADVPGKLELTITLTRFNMPFLLLVAIAAAYMGMLNALRRFFTPSLSPAMYNVVFILCALGLYPIFTRIGVPPIMALTAGMLLGGVAQIVAQWPVLRQEGYRHQWILDFRDPGLREVLILMGPGTLGVAAAQVNIFVNTVLATSHPGDPSALSYAFRLMYLPVGIFGVSVATAAIPDLARHAARGAIDDMRHTLSWGLRVMLVLSIPAAVGLMALAGPIVELLYKRHNFDATSAAVVTNSLFYYAPGIIGYSIVKIASPSFYSLRNARTPVLISVVTILVNLVLNVWLYGVMGFRGLALGTAIAASINAGLLLAFLSKRLQGLDGARVLQTLLKISIASGLMGAAAYYSEAWLHHLLPPRLLGLAEVPRLLRVGGGIAAGIAVLTASAWVLHIDEFRQAMARVLSRFTPAEKPEPR
jgi:putative peptidoglycan lipid II flippase